MTTEKERRKDFEQPLPLYLPLPEPPMLDKDPKGIAADTERGIWVIDLGPPAARKRARRLRNLNKRRAK